MNGTATLMFYFGGSLGYDIEHNKDAVVEEWLKSILRKYLPPKDTNSEIPKPSDIIVSVFTAGTRVGLNFRVDHTMGCRSA